MTVVHRLCDTDCEVGPNFVNWHFQAVYARETDSTLLISKASSQYICELSV